MLIGGNEMEDKKKMQTTPEEYIQGIANVQQINRRGLHNRQ